METNNHIYKEPLIIHTELAYNSNIKGEALIIWGLMVKFQRLGEEKTNTEIAKLRDLDKRSIRRYKKALSKYGGCEVIRNNTGKIIKYIPVDPTLHIQRKIENFLTKYTKFFKDPPTFELLQMQNINVEKLYYIMSGLEYQYRRSKKEAGNSWAILRQCFKGNFYPYKSYSDPNWWEYELEKQKNKKQQEIKEKNNIKKARSEQEDFNKWLKSLTPVQYEDFKQRAIERLKSDSGIPKGIGAKKLIEFEMYEIAKNV